jgi:hypothetical protein
MLILCHCKALVERQVKIHCSNGTGC